MLLSLTNLIFLSFIIGSKLNFLAYFIKNRKCKKGLKYFARNTFFKKGKLRLVKI